MTNPEWFAGIPNKSDYKTLQEYCDAHNAHAEKYGIPIYGVRFIVPAERQNPLVLSPSDSYHAKPEVIAYFKENGLKHRSGDYRPLWKKLLYPIIRFLIKDHRKLCRLNNLHGQ